jgi:hypothetical protein
LRQRPGYVPEIASALSLPPEIVYAAVRRLCELGIAKGVIESETSVRYELRQPEKHSDDAVAKAERECSDLAKPGAVKPLVPVEGFYERS